MTIGSSRRVLRAALLGLAWAQLANVVEGAAQATFFVARDLGEWLHAVLLYAWAGLALGLLVGLAISGFELVFPFSIRRRLDLHRLESPMLFAIFALVVGGYWLNVWPRMPSFTTWAGKSWTIALGLAVLALAVGMFAWRRGSRSTTAHDKDVPSPSVLARLALAAIVAALVIAPWTGPRSAGEPGPALPRTVLLQQPPIVVILVDTVRRDHLGFYGYPLDTSPHLRALASSSIVFDASNTTGNYTIPSTASLFTGLYPSAHGAMHPHDRFPADVPTLAERLRSAGYRTGAFVGNPTMRPEMGYARGFDRFHPAPPPGWIYHRKTSLELIASRLGAGGDVSPTSNLVPRALEWFLEDDPRPPFLYLHLLDPHSGYVPPRAHFEPFLPEGIEDGPAHPPRLFHYHGEEWIPWEDLENGPRLEPDAVAGMVARYDGEIHFVDEWIGRFLQAMRERNVFDDALVIFLSDHGEEFGDHGGWFHGQTLYREMVDMPLLVKLPQGQYGGKRTALSVDMVDLPCTIEGWLGLPPAEGRQGLDLWAALRSVVSGEKTLMDVQPERLTFVERPPRMAGIEWGPYKLIRRTVKGQNLVALFDLGRDPKEMYDLAVEQSELRIEMERMLDAFVANVAREGAIDADEPRDVDPETLRVLRTLGYVE